MRATALQEAKQSWELKEGDLLAPGRLVFECLGGGHDVEVFLVWDERRFCLAVAKALRPHRLGVGRALAHLRREGELLQRLAHPILPRCYDLTLDGERPHLLLEWVEGPTLRRLVRRTGPLAREQWLPLAAHLAAALCYLHNEGVVHLDIKPANVIMGLQPRLLDLGIARPIEAAATLRDIIGTEAWMAPEQCDPVAAGGVGVAADVWGLGTTLYYAVTGRRPFPAREEGGRSPQLTSAPARLPPDVPAALAALLESMLAPRPEDRPTPQEIAAAIAEL